MPGWLFNLILLGGLGLLLGLELRSARFRAASLKKSRRMIRNWSFFGGAFLSASLLRVLSTWLRGYIEPLSLQRPLAVDLVLCFLAAELIGYGLHWIKHVHGWLWRFHFSHHRETEYDPWLTAHTHGLEVVVSGTMMSGLLILLGFSPLSMQVYFLFYSLANTYQHSSFDYSLGWLDKVIVNPSYHRLHHAVGSAVNYGNTLTVWDVVFRTAAWPKSRRAPDVPLGIGDGPEPYGFVAEMTWFLSDHSFGRIVRSAAGRTTRSQISASPITTPETSPR